MIKVKYKDKTYEYNYKSIFIPTSLHDKIKKMASENNMTIGKFLRKTFK